MKDMESVNTVRTSTVMVSRLVRQWSRITLTYPLLTMLFMLILGGWSSEAWGNTLNIKDRDFDGKKTSDNVVTFGGSHVSFTLEGATDGYYTQYIDLWWRNAGIQLASSLSNGSNKSFTFKWAKNDGCTLTINSIRVVGTIPDHDGGYVNLGGATSSKGKSFDVTKNNVTGSSLSFTCYSQAGRRKKLLGGYENYSTDFNLTQVVIDYTITPDKPGVSPTTESVAVTLPANTANPTTINYKDNFSTSDHYGSYFDYAFDSNPNNKGVMSGDNFYATDSGTYKIKARIKAENNCHVASDWSYLTITVNPLIPTFTATNGSVDISIGDDVVTTDLSKLVSGYDGNSDTLTFEKVTKAGYEAVSNATISGNNFSATKLGTYRVRATYAATKQYKAVSREFDVVVGKRTPTFEWWNADGKTHIYASDTLENVAQAKYNGNNVDGLSYSYGSNSTIVVVDGTSLRVQNTFVGEHDVTISVSTDSTDYYKAGSDTHVYHIEPKATPEFWLNEEVNLPADPVKNLNLLIGETAAMRFVYTDESNFQYPTSASFISYLHNSGDHTGVITAVKAGNEVIQFHQTGTTTIFDHSRSIHVYVSKHPVNLSTTLDGGTWKVDSIYDGAVYSIVSPTGDQPALSEVSVTSSNEAVLKKVDGHWKAVGEGTATLTISHPNTNDYWVDQTIEAHITVVKHTPEFTWHIPGTVNYNRSFAEPVSSTNTDEGCTFTYVSGNTAAINYVNGALKTFEKTASNVAITVTQAGNYKWAEHSETFHVNVEKLADHVPFTMNTSTIRDAVYSNKASKGSISCDGNGTITLNQNDLWIGTANSLYYDIHFSGIPNSVSFKYQQSMATSTSLGSTKHSFTVYQKGETGEWSELWTSNGATGDKLEHSVTINNDKLSPSTRYLRFYFDGTYTGYYKNISVTERIEITGVKTVDFGATDAGSNPTDKTSNISWYNVNPLTLNIEGENASQFTVSPAEIASAKDAFAENVPLTISYKHNRAAVKDTATLVITDGTITKRIGLRGTTNKLTPAITWKENLTPMQRGVGVKNPATSLVALTYTSTDPAVVAVIGDSIAPLKKGNATITASFDGTSDPMYNSNSSSIDVVVTDMKVQHINWTQTFTRLKYTTNPELSSKNTLPFALEASVSYYDVDKEEEVILDRPISFTSGDESVVKIINGKLHVVGLGETTLTAHVEGIADSLFEATVVRQVKVHEPTADCETWVLENKSGSINTISSKEFTLNGEGDSIYFDAWREPIKVVIEYSAGDLYLAEVYENGSEKLIWQNNTPKNNPASYKCAISREAKKVKFYTVVGATGYHNFSDVYVRRARYVELENTKGKTTHSVHFSTADAKPGVAKTKSFTVNYSNITDQLEMELKGGESSKFSVVSPASKTIGTDCGEYGTVSVQVQFLSNEVESYKDTLVIHNLNQSVEVYLSADVDKHHQQITWNPATTELKTTDVVSFDATTSAAAAGLSVHYEVVEGDAATVDAETGALTIIKDGTVTIKATAEGNASYYDAEPVSKTFTISKVTPTITTVPTAATMTLPNTSLSGCGLAGGVASVDGTFAWADNTIDAVLNNAGYTVVFTPKNTNWYATTSCVVVVPVNKAAQTIVWEFDQLEMFCNAQITFDAHSSTGLAELPVSYSSSDESIAYVDGNNHLNIIKGGEVTITATQGGNAIYAAAEPVSKTLTINRFAPTIVTLPNASTMKIGRSLSDASLTGGLAELDGLEVEGSFAWVDGNTTVMDVAGKFSKQIVFTPSNTNYYEPVYGYKSVTVEKYAPEIAQSLHGSDITYGQPLSASNLTGTLTATDMIKIPSVEVEGTFAWLQPSAVLNAGSQSATVRFTPANMDWYEVVDFTVQLTVNRATADGLTVTGTSEIFYGQILGEAVPVNTTVDPIHGGVVAGTMVWSSSLNLNEYMEVGSHNLSVTFTVNDPNYISATLDGTAVLTVQAGYVFNGNDGQSKTWGEDTNWINGNQPTNSDRVTVDADVEITNNVTIGGITINAGNTVTVKSGATLTIGDKDSYVRGEYGSIHVENGGNLNLTGGRLAVKDFTLDAQLGNTTNDLTLPSASGQVLGANKLDVNGDAFFQLEVDPCGHNTYGWYDFVVPFEVDVIGGISIAEAPTTPMQFNVNYAVMAYDESKRAVKGKDWNKFSGTMQPGRVYTISLDETQPWNTVIFKKKKGAAITGDRSFTTSFSGLGETKDNGWNGFGNGSLQHMELDVTDPETLVQIYDHANKCYQPRLAKDRSIAVGLSFFMQVGGVETIELSPAVGNDRFMAPTRTKASVDKFCLALKADEEEQASDYFWVSANEEATGEYVIGRDVLKMGALTSSKVARIWSNRNDINLCSNDIPMVDNQANCSISLFAPQAKTYTLSVENTPEDATLYLTYNDRIIWSLSASPYVMDLEAGTTEGYGLRIVTTSRMPEIATGVESLDAEQGVGMRKVMIDNKIYIITPEGAMYDVTGKILR